MREILLLRHAKPDYRDGLRCYLGSRTDPPILPVAPEKTAALSALLGRAKVRSVWSSPMLRSRQTAALIAGDRPVGVVQGMQELDCGEWDGLSFDEIRARYPEEYALRGEDPTRPMPGGETLDQCAARALSALRGLLSRTEGNLAVVAHAGVNRILLRTLAADPGLRPLPQPYLCVNILRWDGEALAVSAFGLDAETLGGEHDETAL